MPGNNFSDFISPFLLACSAGCHWPDVGMGTHGRTVGYADQSFMGCRRISFVASKGVRLARGGVAKTQGSAVGRSAPFGSGTYGPEGALGVPPSSGATLWPMAPCGGDSRGRSFPPPCYTLCDAGNPRARSASPRDRWGRSRDLPTLGVLLGDSGYGARPDLGFGAWLRDRHLRSPLTAMECSRSLGHSVCFKRIND